MKQKLAGLLAMMMILAVAVVGCGTSAGGDISEKTELKLGFVQWACANANSHMVKVVLEEKYDVTVNLIDMEAGFMWQSVATGDLDFMVTAWLPNTHAAYLSKVVDQVVDLGPLYDDAKSGLVVPSYVEIDSIDELNANADKFDGKIIGVDAGAGIMALTNNAHNEYSMTDMELVQSSGAAMTAELKTAYENGEWVVVTGWSPHWMFSVFDLKFLEDPKSVYGEETINVVTRLDFEEDHPEINTFLDNYTLDEAQFGSLINIMEEYDDDNEAAKAWVDQNRELVDSWFE